MNMIIFNNPAGRLPKHFVADGMGVIKTKHSFSKTIV